MHNLIDGKTFSKNLKRLLDERNLTQNDVCKGTGISQATISRYLKPNCKPIKINVMSLAAFFYVNLKWLAMGEGPKYAIYFDPRIDNDKGKIINEEWLKTGKGDKFVSIEAPDTPESTTSDKSIHRDELFEKISDFIGSDTLKESLASFLADLLNDVIHKLIQDEIKEKNRLADLIDQFKNIMINVKPPEGVGERRSCAEQIEKLLRNNN